MLGNASKFSLNPCIFMKSNSNILCIFNIVPNSGQWSGADSSNSKKVVPPSLLKVHALKNFETSSLRSFSTTSNYDTASIKSDLSNFTDLGGALDMTTDDDQDHLASPASSSSSTVQKNFLILERLNKKQQQRREQLRLKRQQQKIDELKQKQHELEIKALQQQHQASNYLISNANLFGGEEQQLAAAAMANRFGSSQKPAFLHSSSVVNNNNNSSNASNSTGLEQRQRSLLNLNSAAYQQQQQQQTAQVAAAPFQLKYYYKPSQQLVQFNLNNTTASPRLHMIQSNSNLNNPPSSSPQAIASPSVNAHATAAPRRYDSVSSFSVTPNNNNNNSDFRRRASFVNASQDQPPPARLVPTTKTTNATAALSPVPTVNKLAKYYVSFIIVFFFLIKVFGWNCFLANFW
jgi:hypothetical protein